jgi:hypothetical protein
VFSNNIGTRLSTCMDHTFTNTVELCPKVVSVPNGSSVHNIVAISRKNQVPKAGLKYCTRDHRKYFAMTLMWMMLKIFIGLM